MAEHELNYLSIEAFSGRTRWVHFCKIEKMRFKVSKVFQHVTGA